MIGFFKDQALTRPISSIFPKTFLLPVSGGLKTGRVWCGDPYQSQLSLAVVSAATTVSLVDTGEFLNAGSAVIGSVTFTYTGRTQSQLTGCAGITAGFPKGTAVLPAKLYKSNGAVTAIPSSGLTPQVRISLSPNINTTPYGFPGMPAIYGFSQITMGQAVPVDLEVSFPVGPEADLSGWAVFLQHLYVRDLHDSTAIAAGEAALRPMCYGLVLEREHSPTLEMRVVPANRALPPSLPGFVLGRYRWRDQTTVNATALVPPNWNLDPLAIGGEKFLPGIGYGSDLELVDLEQVGDAIYPRLTRGEYFTGPFRYPLPAIPVLVTVSAGIHTSFELPSLPAWGQPIFVGTFYRDSQGYYDQDIRYRYVGAPLNPDQSARTDLPDLYFTLDRSSALLTINQGPPGSDVLIGAISGSPTDSFLLPTYPVDQVLAVYTTDVFGDRSYASAFGFHSRSGVITTTGTGTTSIPGGTTGAAVYATITPALVILYDAGDSTTWLEESVNLNPAFSGLSSGYLYLEHRLQTPYSLDLSCDKPVIDVPTKYGFTDDIVAYGPVYFQNDYALLAVTAYSQVPGETVANARLTVQVGANFQGLLNYQDPNTTTIQVVTGGDGKANLIYVPETGFGVWIPTIAAAGGLAGVATTNITGDTLVLPAPVPVAQVYDLLDGWYAMTYMVYDNDPIYGSTTALVAYGEIAWVTAGTPGTPGYKTNGSRQDWVINGLPVYPIAALDAAGINFNQVGFSGLVVKLVYNQALPTTSTIGAYFVSFRSQVTVSLVSADNSSVVSNPILLEMAASPLINENPWLYLGDVVQGILGQFRLGYVSPLAPQV